jgi:diacylglycerol kinase family enzyme
MKILVIINPSAGKKSADKDSGTDFPGLFRKYNLEADIHEINGDKIKEIVKEAAGEDYYAIVAVGGDGTISSAASAVAGTNFPLGVISAGTLNHFAKDLNLPLDPEEAVKVISKFKTKKIDIGEVNGHTFINNSSIGFYPKMVRHRDSIIEEIGGNKWIAMSLAVINIFKRYPLMTVKVSSGGEVVKCKTPFVFTGNNEYTVDLLNLGKRKTLEEGKLSLYFPNTHGIFSILRFAFLGLMNKLKQEKDFIVKLTDNINIDIKKKARIDVSIDGEIVRLETPLNYRIRPKDLTILSS